MAARIIPVITLISLAFPNPWSDAGPESAIVRALGIKIN